MWRRCFRLYVLLCAGFAGGVAWLAVLARQPLECLPARDPVAGPPYANQSSRLVSSVWVAVAAPRGGGPSGLETFDALDGGAFWLNLAMHEFGNARRVSPVNLRQPIPDSVRVLVVTAGAQEAVSAWIPSLEVFAREGGLLVLEVPGPAAFSLAGVEGLGDTGDRVDTWRLLDTRRRVEGLPVPVSLVSLVSGVSTTISGWRDGSGGWIPLVWRREVGRGVAVATAMDVGKLFSMRVQGTPGQDFRFVPRSREGALSGVPVPADMVGGYPEFLEPALDRLERALWWTGLEQVAVPAWWPYPEGAGGAYLCTHDEEGFGDRSLFMVEEEARIGAVATYFVLPEPMTAAGLRRIQEAGGEVALHWHRGFGGGNTWDERFGPFLLQRKAWRLADQQAMLAAKGLALPPITRIHGLQWDPDFDTTFRKLVAAGIRLDSTYGPHGALGPFVFGTLQPFRPLDRTGRLLPILELPFALQDDEAEPVGRLRRLMTVASELHLPVVPIFHTNTMSYKPSVGPLEAWIEGFARARDEGFWTGTMGDFLEFLEARAHTPIVSSRQVDSERIQVDVPRDDLWLRLPCRRRAHCLQHVEMDGRPVLLQGRTWAGHPVVVFHVTSGRHRVTADYGSGPSPCPVVPVCRTP